MRIMRFHSPDGCRLGVLTGDGLADLSETMRPGARAISPPITSKLAPDSPGRGGDGGKGGQAGQRWVLDLCRAREPALPIANVRAKFDFLSRAELSMNHVRRV